MWQLRQARKFSIAEQMASSGAQALWNGAPAGIASLAVLIGALFYGLFPYNP